MITVRVVSRNSGKPLKDKKVAIGIDALLSAGVTHGKWTNSDGEAHFDLKPNYGKVFVGGSTKYEGYLSGTITVSV